MVQPRDQPCTVPKLRVMAVNEALGFLSGVKIVGADYRLAPYEMAVRADKVCAIFGQAPLP